MNRQSIDSKRYFIRVMLIFVGILFLGSLVKSGTLNPIFTLAGSIIAFIDSIIETIFAIIFSFLAEPRVLDFIEFVILLVIAGKWIDKRIDKIINNK